MRVSIVPVLVVAILTAGTTGYAQTGLGGEPAAVGEAGRVDEPVPPAEALRIRDTVRVVVQLKDPRA